MTANVTIGCKTSLNCDYSVKENGDFGMYNVSEHTVLISNPYISSTVASQPGSLHTASGIDVAIIGAGMGSPLLGPEWTTAKQSWGYAWEIHIYFLGGLFVLVELYNIVNVVRFWRCQRLLPTGYFVCLHTLLACVCFTRSVYLLFCGYDSEQTSHASLNYFLYTIPFPCLTSAFGILFSWILRVADLQMVSFSLLKLQVLVPIIVMHYLLSITTDVLIGYGAGIQVLQFASHAIFIVWSLYLFFGYTLMYRKLYSQVVIDQTQNGGLSYDTLLNNIDRTQRTMALGAAVKITFLTATCGLALSGLEAYAVVDVYKMFSKTYPKPWPWWLYHSLLRVLEFVICLSMSYTISLPLKYSLSERKSLSRVLYALDSLCCNYKASGDNRRDRWRLFRKVFSLNSVNRNNTNAAECFTTRYHSDGYSETVQMVKTQPQFCGKSDSLVIVDDVYVRFETDHDINRIVDSFNESSRRSGAFHETSKHFHPSDVANTGDIFEIDVKKEDSIKDSQINVSESLKHNIASSEMFRAPSSVSIAESMEKELIRVFESFKADDDDLDNALR